MSTPPLGQRQTRQRDTIVRVIRDSAGPLTVQEILERAQQTLPGMGIATVYRTLNLLQESGRIEVVILPSGESRYESSDLGHHHHFQCRVCQQVYDLESCPVAIGQDALIEQGFLVESHELTLFGVCARCSA